MKKRGIAVLLVLAVAMGLAGCRGDADRAGDSSGTVSEETSMRAGQEEEAHTEKESEDKTEEKKVKGEEFILNHFYYERKFQTVDSDGTPVAEYDWEGLCNRLLNQGFDFRNTRCEFVSDGIMYVKNYESRDDEYFTRIYAIDPGTDSVRMLWTSDKENNYNLMDFCDGKLCISFTGADDVRKEICFTKVPEEFRFQEEKEDLDAFFSAAKGYIMYPKSPNAQESWNCSYTRTLKEAGFVIGNQDDYYVRIYADGTIRDIGAIRDIVSVSDDAAYLNIEAYDKEYIICDFYNYDQNTDRLYVINLETGETKEIEGEVSFLAYCDGKIYLLQSDCKKYVYTKNIVLSYDIKTENSRILYMAETVPGSNLTPGTESFRMIGGQIFFIDAVIDEAKWVRVDPSESEISFHDTGITDRIITPLRFGTVQHYENVEYCPFCGIKTNLMYSEVFKLDAKYSANAAKINEALKEHLMPAWADPAWEAPVDPDRTEADCEWHQKYPVQNCETMEERISEVAVICGKYLTVEENGYWYGGGAHGYPSWEQFLFDLTTGEEKRLRDFYPGTQEDFKKLVAEKTKENFLSYGPDGTPYFAESADEVYDEAYERADLDATMVEFEETGILVMYSPYDMGPYASGFISVEISYEELLGRSAL